MLRLQKAKICDYTLEHMVKIGLCYFSRSCNIDIKQRQAKTKIPQVAKHFFKSQTSSVLHIEMHIHALQNSLKMLHKANYHPISAVHAKIQRYQVTNPKKIKMISPTFNQQKLKNSMNAYCGARLLNFNVLTED